MTLGETKEKDMQDNNQFSIIGDNPFCKSIVLRRPEEFQAGERPQVSLHLLVKNGESCIGRLLANIGPYIDEIVAVVNDTTDRTISILCDYAEARGKEFKLDIVDVTRETHPELYIMDVPETYMVGRPLAGESYVGPFTGEPVLADWAAIRNLGWRHCTKRWILFLDADDVIQDPESIPGLCLALQANDAELGCSRYVYSQDDDGGSRSESFRERLARNLPHISWVGLTHEILSGQQKTVHIDGNLIVHDMKDSQGKDIRIPGRCFKILYHQARANDWNVPPRSLIYLAMESRGMMPDLASAALDRYLDVSLKSRGISLQRVTAKCSNRTASNSVSSVMTLMIEPSGSSTMKRVFVFIEPLSGSLLLRWDRNRLRGSQHLHRQSDLPGIAVSLRVDAAPRCHEYVAGRA